MRTIIRVDYDGETIFYGRVLTIDRDMFRTRKVHCEGAYTFFMDSVYESPQKNKKMTMGAFLELLIEAHNTCMADCPSKQIYLGEVPGRYSSNVSSVQKIKNEEQYYDNEHGYKTVKDWLDGLVSDYCGHMRVRYTPDTYVDTIGQYGQGNIDLNNRIVVKNSDGSISTEKSFSTEIDGKEVLLPTIINGSVVSESTAISNYNNTGKYLGKFDTVAEANAYAQQLHERQEWYYTRRGKYLFLDYMKTYFNKSVNNQTMSVSSNTVDLSDTMEVNNIFTHVIVVGKGWNYSDGSSGGSDLRKHKITISCNPASWSGFGKGTIFNLASATPNEAKEGTEITLSAHAGGLSRNPGEFFVFTGWTVNSGGVTIENNKFKMGKEDVSITANFHLDGGISNFDNHTVTVRSSPNGFGRAWASCSAAPLNQTVTLHASPYLGHRFMGWRASSSVSLSGNSFNMPNEDVLIYALFDMTEQ